MQMTKKVVSVVIAVMMVVSMMTVMAVSANAATAVAKVGETNYESLEDAIAAISTVTTEYHSKSDLTIKKYKATGTITLLADCEGNGIVIDSGSDLTIDFNGKKYSVTGNLVGSNGTESQGFQLLKDSNVTFKNGTIYSEKAKFLVQNYSNLTLDGMTLTLNNPTYASAYTLSNNNGNTVIEDTTINANPAGGFAFDVCRYSTYPSVSVTVKGDSTVNGNVEVSASGGNAGDGFSLNLESGKMTGDVVVDSSATTAMNATPEKATIAQDTTEFTIVDDPAAKIGSTKYETLEEAFAAAQDGATITLLKDSTGNGIKVPQGKFNTTGLTVDFDGHTYTVNGTTVGSTGTETQGFQLLKDNKITFKDGAITGSSVDTPSLMFLIQNYSDLTLDNMELSLTGQYYNQYTLSNNNGEIVINDSTINAPDYSWAGLSSSDAESFAFDVCRFSSYPSVSVTVTGNSTINGNVEVSASGSDAKDGFSLTLESGTMNGNIVLDASAEAAMAATPAKAEVTKADAFTKAAPEGYKWSDNGDGTATLAPITLQKVADTALTYGIEGLTFVDGTTTTNQTAGYKASLLGVQLRQPLTGDVAYEDGTNGENTVRYIAAVDKEFLNSLSANADYGFEVTVGNKTTKLTCKDTYNTVINDGKDDNLEYFTFAIKNITQTDTVITVKFYVKDGNETAYAKYTKVNPQNKHAIIASYNGIVAHNN